MYYIGIDLGGTNIAVGIVDADGKVLAKKSTPTNAVRAADAIVADMVSTAWSLLGEHQISLDDVRAVGVGSPGAVDPSEGVVLSAGNLGFKNVALVDMLRVAFQKKCDFDKPIYLENDANCALWAETKAGAARGVKDALMVTIGTGIGGGIVINGRLYSGFNRFGGEFGQMIVGVDGEIGREFESCSSASALIRQTKEAAERDKASLLWQCAEKEGKFSGRTAFDAARLGDATAEGVVDAYIDALALGLSSLIQIFQPERILIGGGVSHEGKALFDPLIERTLRYAYGYPIAKEKMTKIMAAQLGNDAGIVGAALLGEEETK